jgi:hypothetical protein
MSIVLKFFKVSKITVFTNWAKKIVNMIAFVSREIVLSLRLMIIFSQIIFKAKLVKKRRPVS